MKITPTGIAAGLILAAVAVYMLGIGPMRKSLERTRRELATESETLQSMQDDIDQQSTLTANVGEMRKRSELRRRSLISPMLNSYAMRAKAFLGKIARESGLEHVEYAEGDLWLLPIPPEGLPKSRTVRRSVKIQARGDYAAIASFILCAEQKLPLMTVQSLTIGQWDESEPEKQKLELVVEWPCEGEVLK